jgi:hypothetical protein
MSRLSILPYAIATLIGAFLVFQIQPVISKCILPWFGGTPAVWTTCMLFFQLLLLGGYIYAHCLKTYLRPGLQALVHATLLGIALWNLRITPDDSWKPTGGEEPIKHLLWMLAAHVGMPYFLLSSTGPLVQAWLSLRTSADGVYRLYALSNIGSLAALLSYPFLFEPLLSLSDQAFLWSTLFTCFVVVQAVLLYGIIAQARRQVRGLGADQTPLAASGANRAIVVEWWHPVAWLLLPGIASTLLLVTTAQLCSEIAVVPFLWILPLSLYLLTFIISFDSPRYYQPKWTAALALGSFVWLAFATSYATPWQMPMIAASSATFLFFVCLICHGEVARLRPPVEQLTRYYMFLSAGGAIGGLIVAIACPLWLSTYSEIRTTQAACASLAILLFMAHRSWAWSEAGRAKRDWSSVGLARFIAISLPLIAIGASYLTSRPGVVLYDRNFFGAVSVQDGEGVRRLVHGVTMHGEQRLPPFQAEPTTYYGRQSGAGKAIAVARKKGPIKVGVIGLGCGVLACYGREGDIFDFIEINPSVVRIASNHFTFLSDCSATTNITVADGRLALERAESGRYDVLLIDAFSSDAIPAHLLTREAVSLYKNKLAPEGILAIHVSNRHLDLAPLVHRLSDVNGMTSRGFLSEADGANRITPAFWVLACDVSNNAWGDATLADGAEPEQKEIETAPLWTDQSHNLMSVLKF